VFDTNETTAKSFGILGPKGMLQRLLLVLAAAILASSALYAGSDPAEAKGRAPAQGSKASITVVNPGADLQSAKDDSVQTFTTEKKAEQYAKELADKLGREKGQDLSAQATYGYVRLYDAPYYGGWRMDLGDGNAVPDFRYLYCFIWCQDYNDRASSLWADNGRTWTIFYEHINYSGERLYVYRGTALPDLAQVYDRYGRNWDNRISSMSFTTY
jgi:hypothetical protein